MATTEETVIWLNPKNGLYLQKKTDPLNPDQYTWTETLDIDEAFTGLHVRAMEVAGYSPQKVLVHREVTLLSEVVNSVINTMRELREER